MKTLCYLQPHRGGGVARHAIEMVRGLASRPGQEAAVLASAADLQRYPGCGSQLPGIPVVPLPFPGKLRERVWKVFRWPSLVSRCHGYEAVYAPAEVRLPRCGVPTLVTIHDIQALEEGLPWSSTPEHLMLRRKWLSWLPKVFREATRVLTVSEFSKQRMVSLLGAPAEKIAVIGNGVSAAFMAAASRPAGPASPTVIVIGGLREKKGAAATLAVAAEITRRGLPFTIEIFGQHDQIWKARASEFRNVHLHGYAPDETVAAALRESTALLFLSPYEGFGIPAVEAMAAGTPAIVANAASLPEVVGSAGIVVEPGDSSGIVDILERLASDQVWRAEWIAKGRERAAACTWERCVDRLVDVLREVAA